MTKVVLFGLSVLCLLIAGCTPDTLLLNQTANGRFVSYEVEFNARPNGSTLQTYSNNRNCTKGSGARKGCVRFEQGTYGAIAFSLRNEGGADDKKCGDQGVRWVITKVEGTVTGDLAGQNKGSGWGASLPTWVRNSFYPLEDADNGILYEKSREEARTDVAFLNLNNHVGEKDLWYRVTATSCESPFPTETSDPRVENDGLN